ncbi:hypothetical protein [Marinobacterium sediminicola]|uniref:Uncharacterized protein n=1 Tax=Marinobacterium sediminicola TaxID=518898 RepID=A0ABY1RXN4_9GAMM|nr:hypothetical protein [Marinobacterium sediminicola]ULG68558.1 hypothetical protein LN244_12750 [Marinobacterium sediminicola]SMR73074.1 hypothetical protein SAMN04487964_10313 [Marinobacterium sediminicola]
MSAYIVTNVATKQTMQARGCSMGEVVNRVCNLLNWAAHDVRVIKKEKAA